MAIRGDNTPPSNTPGSITQTADSNIDRIGNISNVSKTVSNMQKDVKQRITETKTAVDEGQQISMVQKSMTTVLDKLADTVGALSAGVKTITVDTARATKDTISQYGKAISEDISFNKQNTVAMALAKTTPIYGYFAAKFMETDVFKKAAERMKTSIGKAFGSLAGMFRRGKKGPGEDTNIPKMQSGGFVKKGGLTELHAGEIVAPIEKILKRIDDSISTTKDLAKITEKTALHMTTDLKGYIKSSSSSDKSQMNIFRSFIRTYKEVGERAFTEQPVERMARSLLAIQDTLGAQIGNMEQVWQEMLANHPTLVKLRLGMKAMSFALTSPYKITRAFFKVRGFGGYRSKLSKAQNPLKATAENIASLYVDLMWRLDNMIPMIKLTAQTNRDIAVKLTGNTYKSIKGVPKEKRRSVASVVANTLTAAPSLALQGIGGLLGMGGKAIGGKFGKGMGAVGGGMGAVGKGLYWDSGKKKTRKEMLTGAIPESAKNGKEGANQGPAMWVTDTNINKVQLDYQDWVKHEASQIPLDSKMKLIEYRTVADKYKFMKADRVNAMWMGKASKKQVGMLGRLSRTLKGNRWLKWLFIIGGFLKTMLMTAWSPIKLGIWSLLGLNSAGKLVGGRGILGGLSNMFGKGGSATKTFGKGGTQQQLFGPKGTATKFFGKGGTLSKNIASIFGKTGMLRKSIGSISSLMAPGPILGVLAAAGVGVAIGTWINKSFITPFLDKLDEDIRKRRGILNKQLGEWRKDQRKGVLSKDVDESFASSRKAQLANVSRGKLGKARSEKTGQRIMGLGDANIAAIQDAQNSYIKEHPEPYLKYSIEERDYWRLEYIQTAVLNRGWFRDPIKYGREREAGFLKFLQRRGTPITKEELAKKKQQYIQKNKKHFGVVDPEKLDFNKPGGKTTPLDFNKPGAKAIPKGPIKPPPEYTWASRKEEMRESGKQTGWIKEAKRAKEHIENKTIQTIMLAKGLGRNWWGKLDSKSKAAFHEAKKFYIDKLGMSEAEADANLQSLAMKVGDRIDLMSNPETYKTFASGLKEEYKERLPQVMEAKKIIIHSASLHLASAEKMGKEVGVAVKEQTKELIDATIKTGAKGSAIMVNATTNAINDVSNNSTVQAAGSGIRSAGTAGMDYFENKVFTLESD